MKNFTLVLFLITNVRLFAQQQNEPELFGAKPVISINGISCNILNQQFSCTPRTCNNEMIAPGDSIEFCTIANISLTTDTNYYMQWNFNGSSNYPLPKFDSFPTITPICYYPKWNTLGNYVIDIFYNGWLSAYPTSDCWTFGPSHWIINVNVISTGINENLQTAEITIYPNPTTGVFTIQSPKGELEIYNTLGELIYSSELRTTNSELDLSTQLQGIYFLKVISDNKTYSQKLIIN